MIALDLSAGYKQISNVHHKKGAQKQIWTVVKLGILFDCFKEAADHFDHFPFGFWSGLRPNPRKSPQRCGPTPDVLLVFWLEVPLLWIEFWANNPDIEDSHRMVLRRLCPSMRVLDTSPSIRQVLRNIEYLLTYQKLGLPLVTALLAVLDNKIQESYMASYHVTSSLRNLPSNKLPPCTMPQLRQYNFHTPVQIH